MPFFLVYLWGLRIDAVFEQSFDLLGVRGLFEIGDEAVGDFLSDTGNLLQLSFTHLGEGLEIAAIFCEDLGGDLSDVLDTEGQDEPLERSSSRMIDALEQILDRFLFKSL